MSKEQVDATHVYCPGCKEIELAIFEPLEAESGDGDYLGGDIVCDRCSLVIATLFMENG